MLPKFAYWNALENIRKYVKGINEYGTVYTHQEDTTLDVQYNIKEKHKQ